MNHIIPYKVFELKDETYLSAANRLEGLHPKRARALRKFVDDRQTVDIDYIDPRPLLATGRNLYYITNVEVMLDGLGNGNIIYVDLESVNSIVRIVIPNYESENGLLGWRANVNRFRTPWGLVSIDNKIKSGDSTLDYRTETFYFLDRKTAKTFMEIVEGESGEKLRFSINDIYMS